MKITVVRPAELGENELARWRSFQRATPLLANPFLSPEFTVTVGGLRPQARVAVLSDGTAIVGFFPFEQRPLGIGVPIAAGLNDCQGLVHVTDLEWDPQRLLRACRLAVWEFDHLVDGQKPFERYQVHRHASPIMEFTSGFDAYRAQLDGNSAGSNGGLVIPSIRKLPGQERRIARRVGELRFVYDCHDEKVLQALMTWKSAQYQRAGAFDRFARRWIVELLQQLHQTRTDDFSGVLSALYVEDELIAATFELRANHILAGWFSAYDAGLRKYSPGHLLRLRMARAAAASGIHHLDMGRGPEDYKELFKSSDLFVSEGRVARCSAAAAVHWARRASVRRLHDVVVEHQSLYRVADRMRKRYGHIDSALRRQLSGLPRQLT